MEDDIFLKMEDNFIFYKLKMTSIYLRMEDDLIFYFIFAILTEHNTAHNSRQPDHHNNQKHIGTVKN